jgi:hypothetical protein
VNLGRFSRFLIHTDSLGALGCGISPSQGCYLHRGQHKHRINAHRHPPRVGFEPTIRVFERAKTVHALDYATTVIGIFNSGAIIFQCEPNTSMENISKLHNFHSTRQNLSRQIVVFWVSQIKGSSRCIRNVFNMDFYDNCNFILGIVKICDISFRVLRT